MVDCAWKSFEARSVATISVLLLPPSESCGSVIVEAARMGEKNGWSEGRGGGTCGICRRFFKFWFPFDLQGVRAAQHSSSVVKLLSKVHARAAVKGPAHCSL